VTGTEYVRPPVRLGGPVVLARADARWPDEAAGLVARVRGALGTGVVELEHVGSTSVPGLDAKPIVDLSLLVVDSEDEDAYLPALEAEGFVLHVREPAWFGHRLLRHTEPATNLHVFGGDRREHDRMVGFRDLLRRDDAARAEYLATKRELAARHWEHVQDYADAKSSVVERLLAAAERT
jgi:GrpB-like predicted nucleotidyltransferase (UPF0157 family)